MKILITGKFSPFGNRPIGGLQSWILTVHNELVKRGFDVDVKEPHELDSSKYDLGIFSNIELTRNAVEHCKESVLISHGIIDAEKPDNSCDRLMFVSEGVRDHWKMDGDIIRQPIDLEFWKPNNNIVPSMVNRFSYRNGNTHCFQTSVELNRTYGHIQNHNAKNCRHFLWRSLVVFATGRAALEAMACGVPTVIYDHREAYQPALMGENLNDEMKNSYSGRSGYTPSAEQVLAKTKEAIKQTNWREWVAKHHDVKQIVSQLL